MLEGITIGLTHEERTAPALETVLNAVTYRAAKQRQTAKQHQRSHALTPLLTLNPLGTPLITFAKPVENPVRD